MQFINETSVGERYVTVPLETRIKLNNSLLAPEIAENFLKYIDLDTTIEFSKRKTKRRWGTAWKEENRIILYRYSIWMFLHELAHIKADEKGHGKDFALNLDRLFDSWIDFKLKNCLTD